MSRLDRAEQMLRRRRRQSYAVLSSYVIIGQDGPIRIEIPMTRGDTRVETDNGEVIATARVSDFIIDVVDLSYLPSGGGTALQRAPTAGDMIIFRGEVFIVAAIGGGRPYQPHGRDGGSYRIHTAVTTVRDATYDLETLLALTPSNP